MRAAQVAPSGPADPIGTANKVGITYHAATVKIREDTVQTMSVFGLGAVLSLL
jgi:hypothetical protein